MDHSAWLPWAWGGGAAFCYALLCLLQPWRGPFRTARLASYSRLGGVPLLAAAAELLWRWQPVARNDPSLLHASGWQACDSLTAVLTWITHGDVLAMVLAAAFLANSAGLRRGLWKGIESVFPPGWRRILQLALLASATAALGIPAVRFGAGGENGRWAVKILASLWTATSATLLMCWLVFSFETIFQTPQKPASIRSVEMTGFYAARLWLPILAGAVAFPLMDAAGGELRGVLRIYAWPVAVLLAWFPLTALHSTEAGEIHTVLRTALHRWGAGLLPLTGWLAVAGAHFFLFHLAAGWLFSLCPDNSWGRAVLAFISRGAWAWLAVWMLGAWVAIQVDRLPGAIKDARPVRRDVAA